MPLIDWCFIKRNFCDIYCQSLLWISWNKIKQNNFCLKFNWYVNNGWIYQWNTMLKMKLGMCLIYLWTAVCFCLHNKKNKNWLLWELGVNYCGEILRFCSPDTNVFNFNVKASSWQLGNKISLPLKRYQIGILKRFFIQTSTCDLTCLNVTSKRLSSLNTLPLKPKHIVSSEICDNMSLQLIANIIVHVSDCYHQFTCHWLLH